MIRAYRLASSSLINCHQLPSTVISCHQLSSTAINGHKQSSTVINGHQLSPLHTTSRHADKSIDMRLSIDICRVCTHTSCTMTYRLIYATSAHHLFSDIFKSVSCCHISPRLFLSHVYFEASNSGAPLSCARVTSYSVSQCRVYSYIIHIYTYTYKMYIPPSLSLSLSLSFSLSHTVNTYIYIYIYTHKNIYI